MSSEISVSFKLTTVTLENVLDRKIRTDLSLRDAIYHSYRAAQACDNRVFMIDGKLVTIHDDPEIHYDLLDRVVPAGSSPKEYEQREFNELPNDFVTLDLYDPDSYNYLEIFTMYSTPVDKIKEMFAAGQSRVVVWAFNQDGEFFPQISYIERQ